MRTTDPGYFLDFSRFTSNASRLPLERAVGFEPTTASLEGWNSTTELRPPVFFPRPATHNLQPRTQASLRLPSCTSLMWWAGKDSNLGSRWQQIYSLPPLATWVPARNSLHTTQKSTRSIIIVFFHPYDEKRRASWSTHSSPFLIIKDESGDLWAQPCSGNARFY